MRCRPSNSAVVACSNLVTCCIKTGTNAKNYWTAKQPTLIVDILSHRMKPVAYFVEFRNNPDGVNMIRNTIIKDLSQNWD